MAYPSPIANLETRIARLATVHHTLCKRTSLLHRTHEPGPSGRAVSLLAIGTGTGGGRPRVLIIAGAHAREWAPPDAVLTFMEKLLDAYANNRAMVYRRFVSKWPGRPITDVIVKEFRIPLADVKKIVERLELYVIPLVNPDGRAFSMANRANRGWRKNRRPPNQSCPPIPAHLRGNPLVNNDATGVDLNRNYEIAWDIEKYYNAAAVSSGRVSDTRDACNIWQIYQGPSPATGVPASTRGQPEARNVAETITGKDINFFLDVHSFAAKFVYAWGMAENQTTDPAKTFRNTSLDRSGGSGGRDPTAASPYKEWMPPGREAQHRQLADHMADRILDSTGYSKAAASVAGSTAKEAHHRSTYSAVQSTLLGGPTPKFSTGIVRDFAFAQQIGVSGNSATAGAPRFSFTFECGRTEDGGFQPDAARHYPKVEREVAAGLWAFLAHAAVWRAPVPTPQPTSSWPCFIATASYGSPLHPQVRFLRDVRDREIRATSLGRNVMAVIDRIYYSFSPPIARYLEGHPVARALTRLFVVAPIIAGVRGCRRLVSGVEPQGRRVRWLLALLGVALVTVVVGMAWLLQTFAKIASG